MDRKAKPTRMTEPKPDGVGRAVRDRWPRSIRQAPGTILLVLANLLALVAYLFPLWLALGGRSVRTGSEQAGWLSLLVLACLLVLLYEIGGSALGPRSVAALGVLVAAGSLLRLVETALPGPGGFSPLFALIILAGRAFGPRLGFLTGALTLLVSALITGGVGPWLPYQVLAAAWVGQSAGWLPGGSGGRREIWGLALFGALWGLAYGWVLNLWAWTFIDPGSAGAAAGFVAPEGAALRLLAYLLASLPWDAFRAAGNAALILLAGRPILNTLRRLAKRMHLETEPAPSLPALPAAAAAHTQTSQRSPIPVHPPLRTTARSGAPPLPSPGRGPEDHSIAAEGARIALLASAPGRLDLHPLAWLSWALALVATASATRHPIVLIWLLAGIWILRHSQGEQAAREGRNPGLDLPLGRMLMAVMLASALYAGLTAHQGATVLARLPSTWPLIGGPVTGESLAWGGLTGLALGLMLTAFLCFHRALDASALVSLIPRAYAPIGMALTVALTWIPAAGRHLAELREARALRGLEPEGGRLAAMQSWASLLLPLLAGGLERAMLQADLLAARGLVEAPQASPALLPRLLLGLGLLSLVAAWLAPDWIGPGPAGAGLLFIGLAAMLSALHLAGRRHRRTVWRPRTWTVWDAAMALGAWLPLTLRLLDPASRSALAWSPYPALAWPALSPYLALALAGPLLPLLAGPQKQRAAPRARISANLLPSWLPSPRDAGKGIFAPDIQGPRSKARDAALPAVNPPPIADLLPLDQPPITTLPPADPPPIVSFESWGYRYPDAVRPIFESLDLALPAHSTSLLIGPSGAGKSTLLQAMAGLVPWLSGGSTSGQARVAGLDPAAEGPARMGRQVALVPGDPEASFVLDRVADEVAFALEARGLAAPRIGQSVTNALQSVGLLDKAWREIDSLSGGERQSLAIATALAMQPEVMILDEPSSQLDDARAADLLDLIAELAAEQHFSLIMSEHRLDRVMDRVSTLVYLPGDGRPIEVGPAATLRPRLPEAPRPSPPPVGSGPPVLELQDLVFDYRPELLAQHPQAGENRLPTPPLISGLSLKLRAGEILALSGPSGIGKTTVLRLIVGLLRPRAGRVLISDRDIEQDSVPQICRRLAYLPQDPSILFFADTVREELALSLSARGRAAEASARIDPYLARFGIADLADRYPRELSTGQRQRVALAATTIAGPPLLILDEPTRGLDDFAVASLAGLLHSLAAEGSAILIATHDRRLKRACHRELGLSSGAARP